MICTGYTPHIFKLLDNQEIIWKCKLNDGVTVWSDFDNPEFLDKDPWTRLKIYCHNNNKLITEVKVTCPGMPEVLVYSDENGLDNIFITRGMSKDINDDNSIAFRFMCFGQLGEDNKIRVQKFYWPEFELAEYNEVRELTIENDMLLYKKKQMCGDNCKCQSIEQI
jgi:hypothetical protein